MPKGNILETLQSDKQCLMIGDGNHLKLDTGKTPCYLCGKTIMNRSIGSYKCEHILPEYMMAMLTGLPNKIYEQEYTTLIDSLKSSDLQGYDTIDEEYRQFQKKIWSISYGWRHSMCNEVKQEYPFLTIDFRGEQIQIDHPEESENNIKRLLGLLLLSKKSKKRTHRKKRVHHTKPDGKGRKSNVNVAIGQLNTISAKVYKLYVALKSIDSKRLKIFSYLSIIVTLTIQIKYVFNYGPVVWVNELKELFITSPDRIKAAIGNISTVMDEIISNKDIYYTGDNLSDDIIYSGLLLLRDDQSSLFDLRGPDKVIINIDLLSVDDIVNKKHSDNLERFSKFCNFFRSYLNIDYPVRNQMDEGVHLLFKQDVANSINYVWNIWSSLFGIKEIVVDGKGELMDKLSSGPRLDEYASNYKDEIHHHMILERISYSLVDELESEAEDGAGEDGAGEEVDLHLAPNLGFAIEDHLVRDSTSIISETGLQQNKLNDKSLSNMVFMIGDANVYSS